MLPERSFQESRGRFTVAGIASRGHRNRIGDFLPALCGHGRTSSGSAGAHSAGLKK
jgi:hypothetical protein